MVDFGRTASDYAKHRQGFPDSLWLRLRERGLAMPGHRVLDIGTGTGKIAHALHALGCKVEGIDKDPSMIAAARIPGVDFRVVTAEETGAADASFDLVIAGQCWHWFDRARAANEAKRILVPGGALCMAHFDFLRGFPVVDATWKTIEPLRDVALPPASTMGEQTLYVEWLADLKDAGFVRPETFSYEHDARYTREAWRGRMRASVWAGATLDPERTRIIDSALESMLLSFDEALAVPHRVSVVFAFKP